MNLVSNNSLLSVGDAMPDWALIGPDGKPFSFYSDSVAGNILVVLFNPAPDTEATGQLGCSSPGIFRTKHISSLFSPNAGRPSRDFRTQRKTRAR